MTPARWSTATSMLWWVILLGAALVVALLPAPGAFASDDPAVEPPDEPNHIQTVDLTFPMSGAVTYSRDYDQCRGAGCSRQHKATDLMAPEGRSIHAAVGGVITYITGMNDDPPSWGYMITIAGDDGRSYSYVHLGRQNGVAAQAYAPGMSRGVRVARGQHIGWNGCSGNASCSAPHLHFEIHDPTVVDPYDTNRIDPYDSLRAAQARGDLPRAPRITQPTGGKCYALVGDWNAAGRDGIGWWCDGRLRLRTSSGGVTDSRLGWAGDVPVVGDFNGDGVDTVAIVRDGQWRITVAPGDERWFHYGRVSRGDIPMAGDWDGNGVDTVGIIRDGEWHLRDELAGGDADRQFTYGRILQGDRPLLGDWDARGRTLIGIVRQGDWHLRYRHSGGPGELVYRYGRVLSGDLPVMGDWNGDGQQTPAIARGSEWHLRSVHQGGVADQVIVLPRP